jgi:NAD(P)-dependent dehydrogenase (short-subunit alcohol dehydrogenase family)
VAEAGRALGGVDVLVNNAGVAYRSVLEHVHDEERLAQMDVNFLGPMELVRLVLPGMRAKRRGRIINVSSVGGMMAMPTMAVYSASKWALEGASEALWYEVRPFGIHCHAGRAGLHPLDLVSRTRATPPRAALRSTTRARPTTRTTSTWARSIERLMGMARATPESIARKVHRLIRQRRPPLRAQVTLDARVFHAAGGACLPQPLYHQVLYWNLPHVRQLGTLDQTGGNRAVAAVAHHRAHRRHQAFLRIGQGRVDRRPEAQAHLARQRERRVRAARPAASRGCRPARSARAPGVPPAARRP